MRLTLNIRRASPKRYNPRICKRCDLPLTLDARTLNVSIHASVKDATYTDEFCDPFKRVSIHASVKDATDEDGNAYKVDFVSIHASVKDATPCL